MPLHLGRWTVERNTRRINNKIDLSNIDHCGSCDLYMITKHKQTQNTKSTTIIK